MQSNAKWEITETNERDQKRQGETMKLEKRKVIYV